MTEYGEPYEGEKNKGEQTAKTKAGKGKDYDGDGKVESGAKEHAGSVHNAIQRKKGGTPDGKDTSSVKEEFLGEVSDKNENNKKIDVMKGKNKVVVNPPSSIVSHHKLEGDVIAEKAPPGAKFERMVKHIKAGYAKGGVSDKEKSIAYATAWKAKNKETQKEETECGTEPKKKGEKQVDPRSIPTTMNLVKNKLRAMGMKNPMVMVTTEGTADDALAIMRKKIADKHGAKAIIGSPENKKDTEKRKAEAEKNPKPKRKLQGYSIPGAPKEKSYND
jgi:hypothetical protein